MAMIKMSAPWYNFYKELNCFFSGDNDIKIVFDEEKSEIFLYVENERKAAALTAFLPTKKVFGKVEVKLTVVPANGVSVAEDISFNDIFDGNPHIAYIAQTGSIFYPALVYIVFNYEIAQYFNDDLSDAHGCCSKLYQDIAKEIFGNKVPAGTFFCTDIGAQVGAPKQWP